MSSYKLQKHEPNSTHQIHTKSTTSCKDTNRCQWTLTLNNSIKQLCHKFYTLRRLPVMKVLYVNNIIYESDLFTFHSWYCTFNTATNATLCYQDTTRQMLRLSLSFRVSLVNEGRIFDSLAGSYLSYGPLDHRSASSTGSVHLLKVVVRVRHVLTLHLGTEVISERKV